MRKEGKPLRVFPKILLDEDSSDVDNLGPDSKLTLTETKKVLQTKAIHGDHRENSHADPP